MGKHKNNDDSEYLRHIGGRNKDFDDDYLEDFEDYPEEFEMTDGDLQNPFEEVEEDPEWEDRLFQREIIKEQNRQLAQAVGPDNHNAQVRLHDGKYMALYDGNRASDIRDRRDLGEDTPLNYMSKNELMLNLMVNQSTISALDMYKEITKEDMPTDKVVSTHIKNAEKIRGMVEESGATDPVRYRRCPNVYRYSQYYRRKEN